MKKRASSSGPTSGPIVQGPSGVEVAERPSLANSEVTRGRHVVSTRPVSGTFDQAEKDAVKAVNLGYEPNDKKRKDPLAPRRSPKGSAAELPHFETDQKGRSRRVNPQVGLGTHVTSDEKLER